VVGYSVPLDVLLAFFNLFLISTGTVVFSGFIEEVSLPDFEFF
jgi:hypothetical protein